MNPDLTNTFKLKLAKALDLISRDVAPKRVHTVLRNFIVDKHKDQTSRIKQFIELLDSLEVKENRERFNATVMLHDLVSYYIVGVKQGIYTWKSNGLEIGINKTEAINFLLNPKKQAEQEELEKQLEVKKNNN
jgi:hypothetical protein